MPKKLSPLSGSYDEPEQAIDSVPMDKLVSEHSDKRYAAWVDGVCKTCGAYTHSCKCPHPFDREALFKALGAAPQEGVGQAADPAVKNGEPAVAASWINAIPTQVDGVTCRIEDVRRVFLEQFGERKE